MLHFYGLIDSGFKGDQVQPLVCRVSFWGQKERV